MDVFNAFLQVNLEEDVYMLPPPSLASKGSPRKSWNMKLSEALVVVGFKKSRHDYYLFTKQSGSDQLIILIKDLGEMKYFLDLEIARSKHGIMVCQQKFALDLIAELGLACPKPASTPLEQNTISRSSAEAEYRTMDNVVAEQTLYMTKEPSTYRSIVISLGRIQAGLIRTSHISIDMQLADILTKELGKTQHDFLLFKLGMLNLFSLHILRGSDNNNDDVAIH
uniref:Reverse transcriptase Ty1/copia-type domain-containing protein n=1 Tax=Nicotiana tabacum TaxID=4097 RepID=A0A1S3YKD2_TOBAC|nr:PREDICTED: uncharacterized protein LOC107776969 [Nicotiana tabacum]